MTLDAIIDKVAYENIEKYGKLVTFYNISQGIYDPQTGVAPANFAETKLKAVVENSNFGYIQKGICVAGELVLFVSERAVILANANLKAGNKFKVFGQKYTITKITPVFSGEKIATSYVAGVYK